VPATNLHDNIRSAATIFGALGPHALDNLWTSSACWTSSR